MHVIHFSGVHRKKFSSTSFVLGVWEEGVGGRGGREGSMIIMSTCQQQRKQTAPATCLFFNLHISHKYFKLTIKNKYRMHYKPMEKSQTDVKSVRETYIIKTGTLVQNSQNIL